LNRLCFLEELLEGSHNPKRENLLENLRRFADKPETQYFCTFY